MLMAQLNGAETNLRVANIGPKLEQYVDFILKYALKIEQYTDCIPSTCRQVNQQTKEQ